MATTCDPPAIPVITLKAITLPRVPVRLPVFEADASGRIRLVGWYVDPPYAEWT